MLFGIKELEWKPASTKLAKITTSRQVLASGAFLVSSPNQINPQKVWKSELHYILSISLLLGFGIEVFCWISSCFYNQDVGGQQPQGVGYENKHCQFLWVVFKNTPTSLKSFSCFPPFSSLFVCPISAWLGYLLGPSNIVHMPIPHPF